MSKWSIIVDVGTQVPDEFHFLCDPSQECREWEEEKIGGMPPKAVTPVNVSLRPIWDDLLYLPQWMDTEVTVGMANVRLVDQELYIITKFLVEMQ